MNNKLEISDNVHPNTDGSPWGWIQIAGTKIRVATYSGRQEKEYCKQLVESHNRHIIDSKICKATGNICEYICVMTNCYLLSKEQEVKATESKEKDVLNKKSLD